MTREEGRWTQDGRVQRTDYHCSRCDGLLPTPAQRAVAALYLQALHSLV